MDSKTLSKIQDYLLVKPVDSGSTKQGESKDCTVRALANTGVCTYEEAHAALKAAGRKDKKGCYFNEYKPVYEKFGFNLKGIFGTTAGARWAINEYSKEGVKHFKGMTLEKMLPRLRNGTYIVIVTGHAICVKNGAVVDTFASRPGKSVMALFKLETI